MRKKNPSNSDNGTSSQLTVVGIGASAGGMEAMVEILKNLSPDTGLAYVYIQHLSPDHKSSLTEILSRATSMKVEEAEHMLEIKTNHVYVIPPTKDLSIVDGVLKLNERQGRNSSHMPVDQFFVSLAERQKEGAIGIVLSGTANDGTFGLKAIRAAGGVTIVQDSSSIFQNMPRAAIAEDVVDMVLSPKEIASELEKLSKVVPRIREAMKEPVEDEGEEEVPGQQETLSGIIQLVKNSIGVDFTHYKPNTIRRRIVRRTLLHKLESMEDYLLYLKQHTAEINLLYQDLLINVTTFFRDQNAIEYLKKVALPKIIRRKMNLDPIRVWVPACSTGEEAYSLAMLLVETLGENAWNTPIQIFATDLSEMAVNKARLGVYSSNELVNVSESQINRFFTRIDGHFRIAKSIRDLCIFAPQNIFKDPPFSRLDLISCCNLMIYLGPVLQKKMLSMFHYALLPEGYLVLGNSETIGGSTQLFSQVEKKYKVYTKKENINRGAFDLQFRMPDTERQADAAQRPVDKKKNNNNYISDFEKSVDDILLSKYVPASVVVNGDLEILQFKGPVGNFLEPSPGRASLNLLKMARPGLVFDLRNAIHKASKTNQQFKKSGIEVKWDGILKSVSLEVVPLRSDSEDEMFLVIFEENKQPTVDQHPTSISKDKLVKELQEELVAVKEDMRSLIEDQEASLEEMQSANEEIVSTNEELQSINEELETSKEEMESSNEELMTINTELNLRNQQLTEAQEYIEGLFDTIRKGVLVLETNLRVRMANKAFYKMFQVSQEETEGRFVYELGNGQWNIPTLRKLLESVIPANKEFHDVEVTHTFESVGHKVMVLNAIKIDQPTQHKSLILLAIDDITPIRKAERNLEEKEAWVTTIAHHLPVMTWAAGTDKLRNFFNQAWLQYTGRSMDQEKANGWLEGIHKDDLEKYFKGFNESFENKTPFSIQYRLRKADGSYGKIEDNGKPLFSDNGNFNGFIGYCKEL
jgi:two-component system CheB/CheR fusion protein